MRYNHPSSASTVPSRMLVSRMSTCPSYQLDTLKLKWGRDHGLSGKIGQETPLSNSILYSFRREVQEWKEWRNVLFRSLARCSPRGCKESDIYWLNWTEKNENPGWQGWWECYKFYKSFHKIKCSKLSLNNERFTNKNKTFKIYKES